MVLTLLNTCSMITWSHQRTLITISKVWATCLIAKPKVPQECSAQYLKLSQALPLVRTGWQKPVPLRREFSCYSGLSILIIYAQHRQVFSQTLRKSLFYFQIDRSSPPVLTSGKQPWSPKQLFFGSSIHAPSKHPWRPQGVLHCDCSYPNWIIMLCVLIDEPEIKSPLT